VLQLNLQKGEANLRLCLAKAGIHTPPEAEVAFNMDVSGSFETEHRDGSTMAITHRLVPWAMVFDPDKKLDFFTFSDGSSNVVYVGEVTVDNCDDYIKKNVIAKVKGWRGGTSYAPVLRRNLEQFGWIQPVVHEEKTSFFSKLFGGKKNETSGVAQRKSLIMHITDGETGDERETDHLLQQMQDRGDKVYIMFFGFSEDRSVKFKFLKEMADKYTNTGLYVCRDLKAFIGMSDEEINDLIISDELIAWLKS